MSRVGVVGLGTIGGGIAKALAKAGHELTVCDVRPDVVDRFVQRGATAAATPADLAAASDVVVVAVVTDDQARAVVTGPDGLLSGAAPGTRVVVVSTVTVDTLHELAGAAAERGVALLDCGVSGGPSGAASGRLVAMVGGAAEDVEAVRPVLEGTTSHLEHVGPLGAGMRAKLARNLAQYGAWLAAYEAQRLAEAAGIELAALKRIIQASDAVSGGITSLMLRDTVDQLPPDFDAGWISMMRDTAALGHKDLRAALALGEQLGLDLPVARLTDENYDLVLGLGEVGATDDGSDP